MIVSLDSLLERLSYGQAYVGSDMLETLKVRYPEPT